MNDQELSEKVVIEKDSNDVSEKKAQPSEIKYAGFWIRYVAAVIDNVVTGVLGMIVGFILGILIVAVAFMNGNNPEEITKKPMLVGLMYLLGAFIGWAYFIWMTNKYQATLGKKALGLKVQSIHGGNVTLGKLILRETLGKIISILTLFIGFIMAAFTNKKQALHDKMAGSVVIYKDSSKKIEGWILGIIITVFVLFFLAIIGIMAATILVSLNSARDKASDAQAKAILTAEFPKAMVYLEDNGSYKGFSMANENSFKECNGKPLINISGDGKAAAFFVKSCVNDNVYFCTDGGSMMEVSMDYVKSGASQCDVKSIKPNEKSGSEIEKISLVNSFSDNKLGFVNYPENWTHVRQDDKENGVFGITFGVEAESQVFSVTIQKVEGKQKIDSVIFNTFFDSIKNEIIADKGKVYDEKEYVKTLSSEEVINGKQYTSEYMDNGENIKQLFVAFTYEKDLYWFIYAANADKYEDTFSIAVAMLDSWKLDKK